MSSAATAPTPPGSRPRRSTCWSGSACDVRTTSRCSRRWRMPMRGAVAGRRPLRSPPRPSGGSRGSGGANGVRQPLLQRGEAQEAVTQLEIAEALASRRHDRVAREIERSNLDESRLGYRFGRPRGRRGAKAAAGGRGRRRLGAQQPRLDPRAARRVGGGAAGAGACPRARARRPERREQSRLGLRQSRTPA